MFSFATLINTFQKWTQLKYRDVSTPTGRRLLREVAKHPKTAKIEYPLPKSIAGKKLFTVKEVFFEVEKELNAYYGSNYKLKL